MLQQFYRTCLYCTLTLEHGYLPIALHHKKYNVNHNMDNLLLAPKRNINIVFLYNIPWTFMVIVLMFSITPYVFNNY